jgi:Domain of unknown function (DUF4382)
MRVRFMSRHLLVALPVVVVTMVAACGGGSEAPKSPAAPSATPVAQPAPPAPPAPTGPAGNGALVLKITDSPFSEAKALLITFSSVTAHTTDENWVTLPFTGGGATAPTSRTCDLKRLVDGAYDVLGTGPLAAGHYTQLRLTVSSARIYFNETTTGDACAPTLTPSPGAEVGKAVDIPSGIVKLVHQFTVAEGATTTILLDFDGDKSVHQTGNGAYKMQPVIKILSVMQ